MSQNVETIRRACAAWETGDISIYRGMYAPDASAYAGRLAPEFWGDLQGPDEIVDALESLLGTFEHSELVPGEFTEDGDVVVIEMLMRAQPRNSSGTIEWRLWAMYRFRGDQIVRHAWYASEADALEAAGLSK